MHTHMHGRTCTHTHMHTQMPTFFLRELWGFFAILNTCENTKSIISFVVTKGREIAMLSRSVWTTTTTTFVNTAIPRFVVFAHSVDHPQNLCIIPYWNSFTQLKFLFYICKGAVQNYNCCIFKIEKEKWVMHVIRHACYSYVLGQVINEVYFRSSTQTGCGESLWSTLKEGCNSWNKISRINLRALKKMPWYYLYNTCAYWKNCDLMKPKTTTPYLGSADPCSLCSRPPPNQRENG